MRRYLAVPFVALLLSPLAALVLAALSRGWRFPDLVPVWPGKALAYAVDPVSGVGQALAASLLIAGIVAAIAVLVALPAALRLGSLGRHRNWILLLLMAPAAVPGLATAMGLHAVLLRLGLSGHVTGVILVHLIPAVPYAVLVLSNSSAIVDPGYQMAARGLGASRWQAFRHALLPVLRPALAAAYVLAFLVSWSQYGMTLLIGGGRIVTLPLIITQFMSAGRIDMAGLVALIALLPAILLLTFASGRLWQGRTQ